MSPGGLDVCLRNISPSSANALEAEPASNVADMAINRALDLMRIKSSELSANNEEGFAISLLSLEVPWRGPLYPTLEILLLPIVLSLPPCFYRPGD
jgi:hypothetical protein